MNKRPKYFNKWKNIFQKWDLILDQDEKIKLCLNFLKKQKQIDKIILGVLDDKQLKKIIKFYKSGEDLTKNLKLSSNSLKLLNPTNWK